MNLRCNSYEFFLQHTHYTHYTQIKKKIKEKNCSFLLLLNASIVKFVTTKFNFVLNQFLYKIYATLMNAAISEFSVYFQFHLKQQLF